MITREVVCAGIPKRAMLFNIESVSLHVKNSVAL